MEFSSGILSGQSFVMIFTDRISAAFEYKAKNYNFDFLLILNRIRIFYRYCTSSDVGKLDRKSSRRMYVVVVNLYSENDWLLVGRPWSRTIGAM